ncbi:HupE/UreJ family protein [Paraglaciecola sp. 2405UD69-4]|uniref:HupE/UreJ family protein n=1 Tax=Paraglaciecola sp. 2405UD69-4 TaxID=3391836 RepID=UPI0039C909B1
MLNKPRLLLGFVFLSLLAAMPVLAHGLAQQNQGFLTGISGVHFIPYLYLGAKHMVTGYDHLLYLAAVIFFLARLKQVLLFVSLFALGHSITLLSGVLLDISVNPFLVDAIIGLSVCYKALENLYSAHFLNPKVMVFGFGLVHGLGLATKLQDIALSKDGLIANMLAFNLGVEVGQVLALLLLFVVISWLRRQPKFDKASETANSIIFSSGLMIFGFQLVGFLYA